MHPLSQKGEQKHGKMEFDYTYSLLSVVFWLKDNQCCSKHTD